MKIYRATSDIRLHYEDAPQWIPEGSLVCLDSMPYDQPWEEVELVAWEPAGTTTTFDGKIKPVIKFLRVNCKSAVVDEVIIESKVTKD